MTRMGHAVERPRCLSRYLIRFSPYRNGSHLIPTAEGSLEEYAVCSPCSRGTLDSRWRWSEVKTCEVSNAAYHRGYGTPEEIAAISNPPQDGLSFDISTYLNDQESMEKRRNPR